MPTTVVQGYSKLPPAPDVIERTIPRIEIRDGEITGSRNFWVSPAGRSALIEAATPADIVSGTSLTRGPRLHWPKVPWLRLESLVIEPPDPDFIAANFNYGADVGQIATSNNQHGYFATLNYSTKRHDLFIISAESKAEFLKLPPGFVDSAATSPSSGTADGSTTSGSYSRVPMNIQFHKVIPLTEYTFKWLGVPSPSWDDLDRYKGCVNADPISDRINGGELLYSGYGYAEKITPNNVMQYDLTIRMTLRRIPYKVAGTQYYAGWNHVFRSDKNRPNPGAGAHENAPWQRLRNPIYESADFKLLFKQKPAIDIRKDFMTAFGIPTSDPPEGEL